MYTFPYKKKQQQWQLLTLQNARQMQAHMVCSVHLHRHDMLTDPLTVQLQAWCNYAVLLVLTLAWW